MDNLFDLMHKFLDVMTGIIILAALAGFLYIIFWALLGVRM